jgi:hypothetical protein
MAGSRGLTKKHLKALELLKDVGMTSAEVGKQSGLSRSSIEKLRIGALSSGAVAAEFNEKYRQQCEEQDKRIAEKAKALKEKMITALDVWFEEERKKRDLDKDARKTVVDTIKALTLGPTYNIGSVSYSKGLSPEDMKSEFRRLKALALVGGGVREAVSGESGLLPAPTGAGSQDEKGPEADKLHPES